MTWETHVEHAEAGLLPAWPRARRRSGALGRLHLIPVLLRQLLREHQQLRLDPVHHFPEERGFQEHAGVVHDSLRRHSPVRLSHKSAFPASEVEQYIRAGSTSTSRVHRAVTFNFQKAPPVELPHAGHQRRMGRVIGLSLRIPASPPPIRVADSSIAAHHRGSGRRLRDSQSLLVVTIARVRHNSMLCLCLGVKPPRTTRLQPASKTKEVTEPRARTRKNAPSFVPRQSPAPAPNPIQPFKGLFTAQSARAGGHLRYSVPER